jgi:hypothetical protein
LGVAVDERSDGGDGGEQRKSQRAETAPAASLPRDSQQAG